MIIKGLIVCVYDIEVFPNVFLCTSKNTETNKYCIFEISERKNDIKSIIAYFKQPNRLFCGYNNIHYDNPIINYLIETHPINKFPSEICYEISKLSNTIINGEPNSWRKWKYAKNFQTLDVLTMLYSEKLRVGLKEMQVTMKYKNVQEFTAGFGENLPSNQIIEAIKYNVNDVDSTTELLNRCQKDVDLRLAIEQEYGITVLSKDGVNIGMKILESEYLAKSGRPWSEVRDLRSPCNLINLNEIILPIVHFRSSELQDILTELKQQIVSPGRHGYNKEFVFDNVKYNIGVGGIHTVNKPESIIAAEDEIISDVDVASLYPSMIIEHKFYPPHLGEEFLEVYSKIKNERIEAKHNGNKVKNETLKLALNGLSGNLQNEHSWCYSPKTVMQIRMNGQLLLLMLAERLVEIGCRILQANTDGLFVLRKKKDEDKFQQVCKEWEKLTQLVLEEDRFERFYQFAINDYLAIKEGYSETHNPKLLKKKGFFIDEVTLGKGMNAMIIPKAINRFLADGIPIRDTILSSRDIHDFITYQKVNRKFKVFYGDEEVQRINRYYVSTHGKQLFKRTIENGTTKDTSLVSKSGVVIVNDLTNLKEFPTDINYEYYINECKRILDPLTIVQRSLFDF